MSGAEKAEQSAVEAPQQRKSEKNRVMDELRDKLNERGMLLPRTADGKEIVDISKAQKQYFMDGWRAYIKETSMPLEEFYKYYKMYQPPDKTVKPGEYVNLVYLPKESFTQRYRRVGAEGVFPIYIDTMTTGTPTLKAGVGMRSEKLGETTSKVEAGIKNEEDGTAASKWLPYARAEKGGVFGEIDTAKKGNVGILEGMFSVFAEIKDKISYYVSASLGPWIGKINVATGKLGGAFSWILGGFELGKRALMRGIEGEENVSSKSPTIKAGAMVSGFDKDGQWMEFKVKEVRKIKDDGKTVYFTDEKGEKYIAERSGEGWTMGKDESVWKKIWNALNPIKLIKDAIDIAIKGPIKTLKENLYYRFKGPEEGKALSETEEKEYVKEMNDAMRRGNTHTARYYVRTLVNRIEGEKKGYYSLQLDRIEWAIGYRGFFLGYVKDLGFGNKKNLVEGSIEKRVDECIKIIKGREAGTPEFGYAYAYLAPKTKFDYSEDKGLLPIWPYPERLKERIMEAVVEADAKLLKRSVSIQPEAKADFSKIKVGEKNPKKEELSRFLNVTQKAYEAAKAGKDENVVRNLDNLYISFKSEQGNDSSLLALYSLFENKLGRGFLEGLERLSAEDAARSYNQVFAGKPKSNKSQG